MSPVTSIVGVVSRSVTRIAPYSTIAQMIPAVVEIGRKTRRLAGITSAVAMNTHGAGQRRSR
jgi:hypothetical protein